MGFDLDNHIKHVNDISPIKNLPTDFSRSGSDCVYIHKFKEGANFPEIVKG